MRYLLIICQIAVLISCTQDKDKETGTDQLGQLTHRFAISEPARPFFDKGLLLLHSFEYDDAREEFKKAREADPGEIMAYWGLAMSHYKALWGLQNMEAGKAIIAEWEENSRNFQEKQLPEVERALWKSVEILYGNGERAERNEKYVAHMAELNRQNPNNLEIASFYALGLMWADYQDKEYRKRASQIAAGVIAENPAHPGALHYMIHANDDPEQARVAIVAANRYAEVAPDATHALHMPSHIYVALGMWDETVSSNEASYGASLKRVSRKGLSGKERGYHSMAWLHYGYLQQARYDKAADLLQEMIGYHRDSTAKISYLINMQSQQRIESGYWPEQLEMQNIDVSNMQLELSAKAQMHFLKSLLAYDNRDEAAIKKETVQLESILDVARMQVTNEGIAMCSAGPTRYAPNQKAIDKSQVIIHQMKALAAIVGDDPNATEAHFRKATELELESGYDPGPPFIAYPSFEHYGDWLLSQKRYQDALDQFNISLKHREKRTNALKGKITALKALNRNEEAGEIQKILPAAAAKLLAAN